MEQLFSVSEAARLVHTTSETLRHYDRIGLVIPTKKDEQTGYRYYGKQDLVRLQTVAALRQMDIPLQAIKEVLEYDDLEKVVAFLTEAEHRADEKIAELQYAKRKIETAREDYRQKLQGQVTAGKMVVRYFPKRVILLSDELDTPTLENLWGYLSHFYDGLDENQKSQFTFEDLAGIYTEGEISRLFAVCVRYGEADGLKILPEGDYLCADCTEETQPEAMKSLLCAARNIYHADPTFTVRQVVVSGILHWNYQIQVPIE